MIYALFSLDVAGFDVIGQINPGIFCIQQKQA
jgi:hypothetical protein